VKRVRRAHWQPTAEGLILGRGRSAEALLHPEDGDSYEKAKIEINYWQIKARCQAAKAQREAIEVQKHAAAAEAKAAEASIVSAKAAEKAAEAAERNAKYLLWSVGIALAATIIAAISTFWRR
jgi:hypothetical protein